MSHQEKTSHFSLLTFHSREARGLSLIDVVVGVSIITIVFFALFGAFQLSVELIFSAKAKTGATALMAERLEYIRSLPYDAAGTVGGIPAGIIPQLEQVTLNGIVYTLRTLVVYTDAPEDGLGASDENGVTTDYKTAKVEVSWSVRSEARLTSAVTYLTPLGQESLVAGGTLRVPVFDALTAPVPQATVRVVNSAASPAIDVSAQTNNEGVAVFPGAPAASGYEISVSKTDYSSAQTYGVTEANPNPSPGHISIVSGDTTSASFAIDRLGALRFTTLQAGGAGSFIDVFNDELKLSATTSMAAVGGALVLAGSPGTYAQSGSARSVPIAPVSLASWGTLDTVASTPPDTGALFRVYYFDGASYTPVSDAALPGNSAGFSGGAVDLSGLATTTYASLELEAVLSSNGQNTPALSEWSVSYTTGPAPLGAVGLSLTGAKSIGTAGGGGLIPKFTGSFVANALGELLVSSLEWDAYALSLTNPFSYNIAELCPSALTVLPGAETNAVVTLSADSPYALRVVVEAQGAPAAGAAVHIAAGALAGDAVSSACGQTYFGALTEETYTVTITKSGFQPFAGSIPVGGESVLFATLIPL